MKKAKRLLSIVLAALMLCSVLIAVPTTASAATSGDWEYTVNDDFTVTINKYNGYDSVVTVPSKLGGYKVTVIGEWAFSENENITTVSFPQSITCIGDEAFNDCKFLESISLPSNLKTIGGYTFCDCVSLKNITIPSNVSEIGTGAFSGCTDLSNIEFKTKKLEKFSMYMLSGCTSLKKVTIPNGVKEIDSWCFEGSGLQSISIPKTVDYIEWDSFEDCDDLTNINVNAQNKNYCSISGVLYNKEKNTILYLPYAKTGLSVYNGVKECSFEDYKNLKEIIIPPSVTSIRGIGYYEMDWDDHKIDNFTIYGVRGTEAERYAINNDFTFIEMQPESLKLNLSTIKLGAKESFSLKAASSPSWVKTNLKWKSNDKSVVTVSSKGKITAKKAGTAVITATTDNGKTATCTVTVKKAPTKISLNQKSKTLKKGKTLSLSVKFKSGQYSNSIKWSTSNSKVAKVSSKGVVTAKKKGSCTITATTYNGKKATCKIKVS